MSFAISDAVTSSLRSALDGLAIRQRVTADNIANVDTPGYRATSVDFENALRTAIGDGSIEQRPVAVQAQATNTPVGANNNNVDLRKETMVAMQSLYQYQIMTRAVSDRMELVRTVAVGQ